MQRNKTFSHRNQNHIVKIYRFTGMDNNLSFSHKRNTLKITLDKTPNSANYLKLLEDWSSNVPTIYFLDSNCITYIRKWRREGLPERTSLERKLYENLKKINKKQHGVSFFPSIMERVSNQHSIDTTENLIEQMYKDFNTLTGFFRKARVAEETSHLVSFISSFNGKYIDTNGGALHEFLKQVNELKLYNTPPHQMRYKVTKEVCQLADELGLIKRHPVVLTVIASIYDCKPAKGVLKFRPSLTDFNSSNALGDIMMLSRISKLAFPVIKPDINGKSPFKREAFITSDTNLGLLYDCFNITQVKVNKYHNETIYNTDMTIDFVKLLPTLFDKDGNTTEQSQKEFDKLCQLILTSTL